MAKELIKAEEAEIVPVEKKGGLPEVIETPEFNYAQLKISDKDKDVLYAPINDEDIEIRPDGLIYLPWMEYMTRLKQVFGLEWAQIPIEKPIIKDNAVIWGFRLVIKGNIMGVAYGEQKYFPNGLMSWTDALEGAKSNALMRLCKGMGISLDLWKPSFIRQWKAKHAVSYPHATKKDQYGKAKIMWKKKGQNNLKENTDSAAERELAKQSEENVKSAAEATETKKTKDNTPEPKKASKPIKEGKNSGGTSYKQINFIEQMLKLLKITDTDYGLGEGWQESLHWAKTKEIIDDLKAQVAQIKK